MKRIFFALAVLMGVIFPAKAWNNVGHRTIAELAWRKLNKDDKRAISELVKQHPHYKQYLAADVPRGVDTKEWAFLTAAIWPDWVRPAKHGQPFKPKSVTKYDLYPHAVGYPFMFPAETNHALIEKFYIAKPDAEMALSNSIMTLKDKNASAHDRAVSLCWVLHLMGDLHQPLHTANLVTKEKPNGDELGGHHIVLQPRGRQINLHSFWDQLPGTDPSYKAITKLTDDLIGDSELQTSVAKEYAENKTIASWVQEGYRAAVNFAYAEDHVKFVHLEDLGSKKLSASAIPLLKPDYISGSQKIARRRLVLAGQRLVDVLKEVW